MNQGVLEEPDFNYRRTRADEFSATAICIELDTEILMYYSLHAHVEDWLARSHQCAQLPAREYIHCEFVFYMSTPQLCVH